MEMLVFGGRMTGRTHLASILALAAGNAGKEAGEALRAFNTVIPFRPFEFDLGGLVKRMVETLSEPFPEPKPPNRRATIETFWFDWKQYRIRQEEERLEGRVRGGEDTRQPGYTTRTRREEWNPTPRVRGNVPRVVRRTVRTLGV